MKLAKLPRVISLDVTGTLLTYSRPIVDTYHEIAVLAKLADPPTPQEFKVAFKKAYKHHSITYPCFGYHNNISSRQWWRLMVQSTLRHSNRRYTDTECDRYFRYVYQYYGSMRAYEVLEDAIYLLDYLSHGPYILGITTNSPMRTIETVLPVVNIHTYFRWSVSCEDIGYEKPSMAMYDAAYDRALFWVPNLQRDEILHIGDSLEADYCGSKAAGFQALYLDRSHNPKVVVSQDWLQAPDYVDKREDDIVNHRITSLREVIGILDRSQDLR